MNQETIKRVAFVDIDGTILKGQIQRGLIKFFKKKGLIGPIYYFRLILWFVMYRLYLTNDDMKKIFNFGLRYLKGKNIRELDKIASEFVTNYLEDNIYPASNLLIKNLIKEGFSVVFLSTAIDLVVKNVAEHFGIVDYVCTKLEVINGVYTGSVEGDIIYGDNKLKVVQSYCSTHKISLMNCVAYADHESDFPILKAVGVGYVTNPKKTLIKLAIKNNLKIVYTY